MPAARYSSSTGDAMDAKSSLTESVPKVFTEAEYRADAGRVIAHAAEKGSAVVSRADGSPRFMIAIPPAEAPGADSSG
jgi:hypothetical protein